jgi:simple sugar transport system permease protein
MNELGAVLDVALLASTLRMVSPILLAALGGLITERAGIFNIALEGLMLMGAFWAVVAVAWGGSPIMGVVAAVIASCLVALVFGVVVVDLKGDAIVAGLAINLFALGSTTFLMRAIFGVQGGYYDPAMEGLAKLDIPLVGSIPVIGDIVNGQTILVWAAFLFVAVIQVFLFRHTQGIRLRAVGEDPVAASSVGVRVRRIQYGAVLASGALCGLAGAQLSLGLVTQFVEGMVAGRGFIALVAVMFGRAHPIGVLFASLFFGFTYALALRLQGPGSIPPQLLTMVPYVATILALVVIYGRRASRRRAHSAMDDAPPEVEAAT